MEKKITASMTIADILTSFPAYSQKLTAAMSRAGLHCAGCDASTWETLEGGMLGHGMSCCAVEGLVSTLNKILEEKIDYTTISLTPLAAQKFQELASSGGKEGWGLRFGDEVGGCGGYEYRLSFEEKAEENDTVYESHGVSIFVKNDRLNRLLGTVIDYVEDLNESGFKITNPNVKSSCSCGDSQSY